jgi:excisionase family DNA binding protein
MTRALTPEDVADRWQCSPALVRAMMADGRLRGWKLGGKLWRTSIADVEAVECQNIGYSVSGADGPSRNIETACASPVVGLKQAIEARRLWSLQR